MEAARRVQEGLAAPEERVTLKLDLSHAFHSHLIGRGGVAVQRLMQETGAHVHFPDCNRAAAPSAPRSNLVSAAGPLRHVEHARRRLRELMPLVFCLDVGLEAGGEGGGGGGGAAAAAAAAAVAAQRRFGVSVRARPSPAGGGGGGGGGGEGAGGSVQLQVRGAQEDLPRLRAACAALARQLRGDVAPEGLTQVHSWLQMSGYNAGAALGRGGETLRRIAAATGARLLPPDPPAPAAALDAAAAAAPDQPGGESPHGPGPAPAPRGAVHISGPFDAVFLARQQLLGSLPLKLVFDIPENFALDGALVVQLMNVLGVNITTFQKEKQHLTTVTIRGTERFATNIYEARRILLGITEAPVIAEIPETYHIPTKPLMNGPAVGSIPKCYGNDNSSETCPNRSTLDTSSRVSNPATGNNGIQGAPTAPLTDSEGRGVHSSWLEMLNSLDFIQNCLKSGNPASFELGQRPLGAHGNNFTDMQLMTNPSTGECNITLEHAQNLQNSHFGVDTLLFYMGLQKYIDLFHAEEIDWPVFQTLNEQDLINIGITAYGSRRKILGIIAALKKFQIPFSGSAAPGAERRGPVEMQEAGANPW